MTTQEAYEQIRAWFTRPGAVFGWDEIAGECVYRGEGMRDSPIRCAVGCLIPNELYNRDFEGMGIYYTHENFQPNGLIPRYVGLADFFAGVDLQFLSDAQTAHDRCAEDSDPMADFIAHLDNLATGYELNTVEER